MEQSISVVFPCYNDAGTIGSMIAAAHTFAQRCSNDFEIIVVDDGSQDHSRLILEELRPRFPALKVIFHEENRGYGGALRSGFAAASKDLIFYTDGDGQYDPAEFENLYRILTPEIDVINGFKVKRNDPAHRVVVGKIYQHFVRCWFWLPIRDIDCDFRLMRRSALEKVPLKHDSGVICVEMIKKLHLCGCTFAETGVSHYFRLHGRSQFFNLPRVARALWDLAFLWLELVAWRRVRIVSRHLFRIIYGLYQPIRR